MRFSWSNHLLTILSLETLTSIIRTDLPILMELINLVNSATVFLSQMTLLRWLTFLLGSQAVILIVQLFWIYLFLDSSICSKMAFPTLGHSDHVFVFSFHQIHNGMPRFIAQLMTQGSTYLFEVLSWKFILSQSYVGVNKDKNMQPNKFSQPIGQYIPHSYWKQTYCLKYTFSGPSIIYLFKFSRDNSKIKCDECSKLKIEIPEVVLVSLLWIYLTYCSSVFFC